MGITRDLNVEPYFDDFEPVALDKNYHRVLFKPSVAVQARELTQIQSILQNQIERFSDNILVEGTIVKGGNFIEVNPLPYVKILDNNTNNQPVVLENYVGLKAVGVTTGVEAQVITFANGFQSQSPDLNTLYVKYTSASTATGYSGQDTFNTTENINIVNSTGEIVATVTVAGVREGNAAIGNGYGVRCGEGIIYQKGHFITFEDQIVVLDKYTTAPNAVVVGFRIEEIFVDSFTDESLLDNAAGFPNENAPGADRLQLIPILEVKTIAEAQAENNYFTIQEYQNGRIVRRHTRTQYSIIGDEIARRTSEESGNYSLGKFKIRVDEHIANTVSGEISTEQLQASISPGIAYVDGNRVEILAEYRQLFDKATDFLTEEQQNITAALGNYVVVTDYLGDFDFTKLPSVELRSVAHTETSLDPTAASPASPGSVIGTARVRSVLKETESRYRLYLFDIDMTDGAFSDVKTIRFDGDAQAGLANVVLDTNNEGRIVDSNFKKAIFPLGRQFIKTLSSTECDYISRTKNTVAGISAADFFTVELDTGEEWPYSGTLTSDLINEFVVTPDSTSGSYTAGEPIASFDDGGVYITGIVINGAGTEARISLSAAYTGAMIVYHNVKRTAVKPIGKELNTYYMRIAANTHADLTSGEYSLGVPDVFEIDTIWKGANNTFTDTEAIADSLTDVTAQFTLKDNSKDGLYDLSYIQKKSFAEFGDDDSLLVKFKAFTKNTSNGEGFGQSFFSIDSYPLPGSGSPSPETVTLEQLPVYTSEAGLQYNLRDVIDFRPYSANAIAYATSSASAPILNTAVDALTKAATFGSVDLNLPAPNKAIELDYEYYVPRIDKLYLDSEGQVGVSKGISAELPKAPRLPENVMELATLLVAPFPSLPASVANRAGHPEYAVSYITPQNRRYTMQDIGKIDRRVKQIEYYTALNSLEKKADDLSIKDSNGLNRFKNGIFVDNFSTYGSADVKNPAFSTSIDPNLGEIAPRHRQWFLDLMVESTTGNIKTDNNALTLDYSEVPMIEQPFSSITRSCTNDFYKFSGEIFLFPEYDSGTDTTRAPDIQLPEVDLVGAFSDFAEALNEVVTIQGQTVDVDVQSTTTVTNNNNWWWWNRGQTTTTTTSTTTTVTDNEFEVLPGQETVEVVGDFVTDARFSPFLRSIEVEVEVFGLLPNKTLYFYFDGQPVAQHIASAELMGPDSLSAREPGDQRILNRTSEFGGGTIVADADGAAKAIFRIPAETFYVGDRLLEVSSEPTYESIENSVSYAKKMYRGYNFSVEKSSLISTTREPEFRSSQTVASSTDVQTQSIRTGGWWWNNWWWGGGGDPLAQTFFVSADMSADTTVQITSLDVYFSTKSTAGRSVTVEIVEAVNGFPGDKVMPFSKVRKEVTAVSVDPSTALLPTTFEFSAPVTLQTDREYAIIVQPEGNDPDYTVWVARTGDRDITTGVNLVTDTNAGVLFTSSNKRVWTPYQDQNLKFTLNKASFINIGGTSSVTLTNKNHEFLNVGSVSGEFTGDEFVFVDKTDGDSGFLGTSNNITVTSGSRTITTSETGAFNGIDAGDFIVAKSNTERQVLKVILKDAETLTVREPLLFSNTTIELFTTVAGRLSTVHTSKIDDEVMMTLYNSSAKSGDVFATDDVLRGAESNSTCTILSVYDIPASYFNANIYRTTSPGTSVTATFGNQALELSKTKYITSVDDVIMSRSNEVANNAGNSSFSIDVNMTGTADSSPMIDYQISTVFATEYIVNELADDDVTEKTNFGDAKSKYISKVIELAEGMDASDLRLYLTGYRPVGSDIKVYVKLQNASDLRAFDSINWTEMELKDSSNVFSNSTRRSDFREFEYQFKTATAAVAGDNAVKLVSGTDISDGFTYKAPDGNDFNTYKYFSIKIVLEASNRVNVPRVDDIRAIALA